MTAHNCQALGALTFLDCPLNPAYTLINGSSFVKSPKLNHLSGIHVLPLLLYPACLGAPHL